MKKVIVLGSLNMDLSIQSEDIPKNGETINGSDFFMNPGGKGGNQAVAAAKLGAETHMIANVGNDVFGKEIIEKLQEYGVATDSVLTSDDPTGVAVILRCHNDNRIILGNGANHTMDIQTVKHKIKLMGKPGDIFLTQLENDYELVLEAICYAKSLGLYTILNPAPARVLDERLYESIDLIVVNQSECQLLTGIIPNDEDSCQKAIQCFNEKGVDVIITLGTHGSIAKFKEEVLFVASRDVETVDTTGAGDSYIGALCSCLAADQDILSSLQFSTKVAALTVTRRGAQHSIPYKKEVEDYFKEEQS